MSDPSTYTIQRDGAQWCATRAGFVNVQESVAGFGDSPAAALAELEAAERHTDIQRLARDRAIEECVAVVQARGRRLRSLGSPAAACEIADLAVEIRAKVRS